MKQIIYLVAFLFIAFGATAQTSQTRAMSVEKETTTVIPNTNTTVQPTGSKSGQMTYNGCQTQTNHRSYQGSRSGGYGSVSSYYRQYRHHFTKTRSSNQRPQRSKYDMAQEWYSQLDSTEQITIINEYQPYYSVERVSKSKSLIYKTYLNYTAKND